MRGRKLFKQVKEVADLVGISIRTLHHYDNIGLLTPKGRTEAGYRRYDNNDLDILQQILFFRELDFPLKKIKDIIYNPSFNRADALHISPATASIGENELMTW